MGRATKAAARRFLEQQSPELPFCLPQQQSARQPQQQYRFSGVLCAPCGSCGCPGEHSSASELAGGNQSGVHRRVQTRSGDAFASKNPQRLDSLVGYPEESFNRAPSSDR